MDTLDIAPIEPTTAAGKRRAETLRQLHRDGTIPTHWLLMALQEADKPIPSPHLRREHAGAWCRVWSRPQRSDAGPLTDVAFAALVEDYDRGESRNEYFDGRRREREEEAARQQRERDAADTARREQEAEALKAQLRQRYLRLPGTTEAEFQAEFPQLLADHRRAEMERTGDAVEEEMRRTVWQAMHQVD